MLYALVGYLSGFDGSFKFENIGDDYLAPQVPYIYMRAFAAICGALIVPMGFEILKELKVRPWGIAVACSFLLFDNALFCISRLILLDGPLMFFIVFSCMAWTKFYHYRGQPYSRQWWKWLALTGVGIGCATSVKMVGLFVVSLVGLATVIDLWRLLDIRKGLSEVGIRNSWTKL